MKKVNLLSRAEMKKVIGGVLPGGGGGGTGPGQCEYYIYCMIGPDNTEGVPFYNNCCSTSNSLSEAETFCRNNGYTGVYGCVLGAY